MRLLRIIVNWSALLTLPVWGGLLVVGMLIYEAWKETGKEALGYKSVRGTLKGKWWFFEK